MSGHEPSDLHARQLDRERSQREAALGRRARSILRGDLGPVLRRWVSGSITPVSVRLKAALEAHEQGDWDGCAASLASPVFGLPEASGSPEIGVVARWALKGGFSNLDDLVFSIMGTAISTLAVAGEEPTPMTRILHDCGAAARETALGQFITQVQGSKAMLRVRKSGKAGWRQGKQMDAVAGLLSGQVHSGILQQPALEVGGKAVVKILTQAGDERRIELRVPEPGDWALLDVARSIRGEKDTHAGTWVTFAMMTLCAAQAEAGWFDLVKVQRSVLQRKKRRSAAHGLVLSDGAYGAIKGDLDKWLRMGFLCEPMLVKPESGDYLSVKHRAVTGGKGPMGNRTHAEGSAAWAAASETMAGTAWTVPGGTLQALRDEGIVRELSERSEPDEVRRETILNGYRRLAQDEFYLPIYMDFRGRVYTRSPLVTYQGGDLQKSLLCFPAAGAGAFNFPLTISHITNLYAHGLDKAPLGERVHWWYDHVDADLEKLTSEAKKPLQFYTAMSLHRAGQTDRIALQIDGTCNGLQHLSALFRDETAAPFVNLTGAPSSQPPADIYGSVAAGVRGRLDLLREPWARRLQAAVKVDRDLCKKPVMVLPYGGTRGTIEDACLAAILEQVPYPGYWLNGWMNEKKALAHPWPDWVDGDYAAFQGRELKDHPLLHLDAKRLAGLVWEVITEVLPRPMLAMQAFRDIAKAVGDRTLEWSTGFQFDEPLPDLPDTWVQRQALWVVQAKAKSKASSMKFKGMALPGSIRGLQVHAGRDEIDPKAHTTGIVANFIHSQDACHLARTQHLFRAMGGRSFGANHDCFMTRPSEMGLLAKATRIAFRDMYRLDPLSHPVMMRSLKGDEVDAFPNWYDLARQCGVSFPEKGTYDVSEVINSHWFFS